MLVLAENVQQTCQRVKTKCGAARGSKTASGAKGDDAPVLQSLVPSHVLDGKKMTAGAHNAMVFENLKKDMEVIFNHPVMADLATTEPFKIIQTEQRSGHESGHAEPFNVRSGAMSLLSTGIYDTAINFFWTDMQWTPRKSVPLVASSIDRYALATWADAARDPEVLEFRLDIVLDNTGMKTDAAIRKQLTEIRGRWQCVTDPQLRLAPLRAACRAIRSGADNDLVAKWKRLFLTVSCRFVLLAPERFVYRAMQLQMEHGNKYQTVASTPLQKILEITAHKERMEDSGPKVTPDKVAKDLNERLSKEAIDATEKITDNFVDSCCTISTPVEHPKRFHCRPQRQRVKWQTWIFPLHGFDASHRAEREGCR